ncbi:MAG: hypothetical protein OHK0052_01820 [Anaerolineales bacterium]
MKKSRIFTLLLLVALALLLAACKLPASTPPPAAGATPTTSNQPVPATEDAMQMLEIIATQTAMAAEAGGGGEPTPIPPTEMPTAEPKPTEGAPVAETPVVMQPTPVISVPASYALQKGEFPFCIARRFNVNQNELLALNGLSSAQSYYAPGTVLKIPQTGKAFDGTRALRPHPTTYTVKSGESVYDIACYFGDVAPESILAANGLAAAGDVKAGQTLQIP